MTRDPASEYRRRLERCRRRGARFQARAARLSWLRLLIFGVLAATAWPVLFGDLPWVWTLLPLSAFVVSVVAHERVLRGRTLAERGCRFYERGLDRVEGRWIGHGVDGSAYFDPEHPYAADLDLHGPGSLFQRINRARTRTGERRLAIWLSRAAAPPEIRERQQAVAELRDRIDLRESLAVLGDDAATTTDADALVRWSGAVVALPWRWPPLVALLLALGNLAGVAAFVLGQPAVLLAAAAASGAFVLTFRRRVARVLGTVDRPERDLVQLALLLECVEGETFSSPLLERLRQALEVDGAPPSRRIATLARLVELNDSRRNMLFLPFASLLLLGTQLAFAMERWRGECGGHVERWIDAVGEYEALSGLAGYAFECPDDPFPEIVEAAATFRGEALAHPLLPRETAVRNDLELGGELRLYLVSGSNMSGKSTLLRTVGVNAVLALCGAPVRAKALVLSPLQVAACMRVQDSLQQGLSHFYAEIRRLRTIVERCDQPPPVLFLLDEILHGTNSHDRRVGARALIHGLVRRGAIGLVTTHDLALAAIAEELDDRAANVHFVDHLEGDRVVFDYRLRPGVVKKSNALDLMRAVGLEV